MFKLYINDVAVNQPVNIIPYEYNKDLFIVDPKSLVNFNSDLRREILKLTFNKNLICCISNKPFLENYATRLEQL